MPELLIYLQALYQFVSATTCDLGHKMSIDTSG